MNNKKIQKRTIFKRVINTKICIYICITLVLNLLVFNLNIITKIYGEKDQDLIEIISPEPNQKINKSIEVLWKMYDSEQQSIKYSAKIHDSETCGKEDFGNINEISTGISSQDIPNKINWNGKSTTKKTELDDGKYCLKICGIFLNNNKEYSMCTSQNIRVIFKNNPPFFVSLSPKGENAILKTGTYWEYQVKAEDKEKDTIIYRIVQGPPFLEITQNGKLRTKDNNWTIPPNLEKINYNIIIGISDNLNDEVYQNFKITVEKNKNQSEEITSKINILTPKANSIFTKENSLIEVEIEDKEEIQKVFIEFSKNQTDWTEIFTKNINSKKDNIKFKWNINNIPEGEYYLKVNLIDSKNRINSHVSDKFKISHQVNTDKEDSQITQNVTFTDLIPQANTKIQLNQDNPRLEIKFKIVNGEIEINKNTLSVNLNNNQITQNCKEIEDNIFECLINDIEIISEGSQKIEIQIQDTKENIYKEEIIFIIEYNNNNNNNLVNIFGIEITQSGIILIILLCCSGLLLLIVPWILISKSKNKKITYEEKTTVVENVEPTTQPLTTIQTNIYTPEEFEKQATETFDYSLLDKLELENVEKEISKIQNTQSNNTSQNNSEKSIEDLYPELKDFYNNGNSNFVEPEKENKDK